MQNGLIQACIHSISVIQDEIKDVKSSDVSAVAEASAVTNLTHENIVEMVPDYLKCMCKNFAGTITPLEALQVVQLLLDVESVFQHPDRLLGVTPLVEHTIDVQGHYPIKQAFRRLPYHKLEIVKAELDKMLESNNIQPSSSPWSSPVVLVTKKD